MTDTETKISTLSLMTVGCKYPVTGRTLRWTPDSLDANPGTAEHLHSEAYAERAVTHTGSLAGPLGIKLS